MAELELQAQIRKTTGAGSARNLIRSGQIPAVLYGNKQVNISISLPAKEMEKLLRSGMLTSTVIALNIDGQVHKTLIKQFQINPVKDTLRHVDLMFINQNGQTVDVPIVFEGKDKCLGIKRGGFFNTIHRKFKLICDPNKIPETIAINVVNMSIGSKLLAKEFQLPEGTRLAIKDTTIIATITGRGKSAAAEDEPKK
jgi:large subunit ribosomal protein L25